MSSNERRRPSGHKSSGRKSSTNRSSGRKSTANKSAEEGGEERLQKVLAAAGLGSRRQCEELIVDGRVEVDRRVVTKLGTCVDRDRAEIRVDGVPLSLPKLQYFLLNKPPGVLCTNSDPEGRLRAVDLIRSDQRLFTIGRLDRSSEGLILITNDGSLAHRLAHPRYQVSKTYRLRVAGVPDKDALKEMRQGVHLAEALVRVESVRVRRRYRQSADLEVVLKEGRNRELRRLLAKLGHKVLRLQRTAIGPLRLGNDLPPGAYRELTRAEVARLQKSGRSPSGRPPSGRPSGRGTNTGSTSASGRGKPRGKAGRKSQGRSRAGR